jgi:hypothetical protein
MVCQDFAVGRVRAVWKRSGGENWTYRRTAAPTQARNKHCAKTWRVELDNSEVLFSNKAFEFIIDIMLADWPLTEPVARGAVWNLLLGKRDTPSNAATLQ